MLPCLVFCLTAALVPCCTRSECQLSSLSNCLTRILYTCRQRLQGTFRIGEVTSFGMVRVTRNSCEKCVHEPGQGTEKRNIECENMCFTVVVRTVALVDLQLGVGLNVPVTRTVYYVAMGGCPGPKRHLESTIPPFLFLRDSSFHFFRFGNMILIVYISFPNISLVCCCYVFSLFPRVFFLRLDVSIDVACGHGKYRECL